MKLDKCVCLEKMVTENRMEKMRDCFEPKLKMRDYSF